MSRRGVKLLFLAVALITVITSAIFYFVTQKLYHTCSPSEGPCVCIGEMKVFAGEGGTEKQCGGLTISKAGSKVSFKLAF